MPEFTEHLLRRIDGAQFADFRDNFDYHRFGGVADRRAWDWLAWQGRRFARRLGFTRRKWRIRPKIRTFATWMRLVPDLEWFYERLYDDDSRTLLLDVIAYRIMGYRGVRLSTNTPEFWRLREQSSALADPTDSIPIAFNDWKLLKHDLTSVGYPIKLYAKGIATQFLMQQYACERYGVNVTPGDVVIDGGACFGDTALYFAHRTGPTGKVYSFEFVDSNMEILRRNLDLNPDFGSQIKVVKHPLWSRSGLPMLVNDRGPASKVRLLEEGPTEDATARTLTIDDFVAQQGLDRVDFIKMDIEGAETEALKGAEQTIVRCRPKMAICLYHRPEDFVTIPRFLDRVYPDYRFSLGHFTIHAEETVLYAWNSSPRN